MIVMHGLLHVLVYRVYVIIFFFFRPRIAEHFKKTGLNLLHYCYRQTFYNLTSDRCQFIGSIRELLQMAVSGFYFFAAVKNRGSIGLCTRVKEVLILVRAEVASHKDSLLDL